MILFEKIYYTIWLILPTLTFIETYIPSKFLESHKELFDKILGYTWLFEIGFTIGYLIIKFILKFWEIDLNWFPNCYFIVGKGK